MTLNVASSRVFALWVTCTLVAGVSFGAAALAGTGPSGGWSATINASDGVAIGRSGDLNKLPPAVRIADGAATSEEEAAALYADAQIYMSLRAWSAAERILGAILTQHADTAIARQARADLKHLHENVYRLSNRSALGGPNTLEAPNKDQSRDGESGLTFRAPWGWLMGERSVQDQFRMAVGDRLFFAAYSAALGTRNRATLEAQAAWLKQNPDLQVTIEAHADEPGRSGGDLEIAQARANVVRDELVAAGITSGRIKVVVYGRAKRVAVCESPACRAQNRRVVMRVDRPASIRAER